MSFTLGVLLKYISNKNYIKFLKLLKIKKTKEEIYYVFEFIISYGDDSVECVNTIMSIYNIYINNNDILYHNNKKIFRVSCRRNNIRVAKFLLNLLSNKKKKIKFIRECIEPLDNNIYSGRDGIFDHGNLKLFEWTYSLCKLGPSDYDMNEISWNGHLKILKWIYSSNINIRFYVFYKGNSDKNIKLKLDCFNSAVIGGQLKIVKYLYKSIKSIHMDYLFLKKMFKLAYYHRRIDILLFIHSLNYRFKIYFTDFNVYKFTYNDFRKKNSYISVISNCEKLKKTINLDFFDSCGKESINYTNEQLKQICEKKFIFKRIHKQTICEVQEDYYPLPDTIKIRILTK